MLRGYNINLAHKIPAAVESYDIQMGQRGCVVLPAEVRRRLKLTPGDRLILTVDESGEMRLAILHRQLKQSMGMFARLQPRRIASEELIAERREQARRE